jgi:hypothetical protein
MENRYLLDMLRDTAKSKDNWYLYISHNDLNLFDDDILTVNSANVYAEYDPHLPISLSIL